MKKAKILNHLLSGILLMVIPVFSGCFSFLSYNNSYDDLDKDYEILTPQVSDFTEIQAGNEVRLTVCKGSEFKVSAKVFPEDQDLWSFKVLGNTLMIRPEYLPFYQPGPIEVVVQLPELEGLQLSGAAIADTDEIWISERVNLELSGTARLGGDGGFMTKEGRLNMSGSSFCQLKGQIESLRLEASGKSDIRLQDLLIRDLSAQISGATSASVTVLDTLTCQLSGASVMKYDGQPEIEKMNLSGASRLTRI